MFEELNLKSLKTEEIATRLMDLRTTLVAVLNQPTMHLLEEVERRLGGGGPLTPIEQLPKKERELRETYEFFKSFASRPERKNAAHPGLFRMTLEPYQEWKVNYLTSQKESASKQRAESKHENEAFQRAVTNYF